MVGDLLSAMHGREGHTGQNTAAFDQNSASSAFAAIARFLWTGQSQFITQRIEQCHPRLDGYLSNRPVDCHSYIHVFRMTSSAVSVSEGSGRAV